MPWYAAVDVGALFVDGGNDAAGGGVEAVLGLRVADALDDAAGRAGDVHVGAVGVDLAAYDHQAGGAEGFTGDVGLRVLAEEFVENGVGNLVSDFVGMTFGDGLRCKEVVHLF